MLEDSEATEAETCPRRHTESSGPHAEACPLGSPTPAPPPPSELELKPRDSTCSSALLFLELLRTG